MSGRELLDWGLTLLRKYKKEENIAYITLKYIDEKAKYIFSDLTIPETKVNKYKKAIRNYIEDGTPIAFTFNYVYFYNQKLNLTKNCFMPRFETEQLVDELSGFLKESNHYPNNIIDICTGVGAIPLSLSTEFKRIKNFDAFDINEQAIFCAKKSSKRLKKNINFFVEDFFTYQPKLKYDLVIMNPPYIGEDEKVEDSVLKNDPLNALFSKDNGFIFYKELINKIDKYINKDKFIICFEIGKDQGPLLTKMVSNKIKNCEVKIIKDYQQLDRIFLVRGKV